MSKTIKASEFKAKCLALMDEVARTGESVVVTKKGEPLVELVPHKSKAKKSPFGILKGELAILSVELENLPADPADRLIMATAIKHSATLITADEALLHWQHPIARIPASK